MVAAKLVQDVTNERKLVEQFLQMDKPTIVKKSKSDREALLESGIHYTMMLEDKRKANNERKKKYTFGFTVLLLITVITVLFISIFVLQDVGNAVKNMNRAWEDAFPEEQKIMCEMSLPLHHYTIEFDGRMPFEGLRDCPYVEEGNETLINTDVFADSKPVQTAFPIYFNVTQSGIYLIQFTTRLIGVEPSHDSSNYEVNILETTDDGLANIPLAAFSFAKDREQTQQAILKFNIGDVFYFSMVQAYVMVNEPKLEILKLFNVYD